MMRGVGMMRIMRNLRSVALDVDSFVFNDVLGCKYESSGTPLLWHAIYLCVSIAE